MILIESFIQIIPLALFRKLFAYDFLFLDVNTYAYTTFSCSNNEVFDFTE